MTIVSGHSDADYRYAHHMGSGEHVPARGWAQISGKPDTYIEVSGYEFPRLDGAALEAKCVAIINRRRYGKFSRRR